MAEIDLAAQLQQLYQRFGQLPGVHIELHQNLVAVFVKSKLSEARIFLQGAQICHFQPAGQAPVLWLSEHNQYLPGQPLRGGIPISWPWFADLPRNPEPLQQQVAASDAAPAHGFARNSVWQLDDITRSGDEFTLCFSWQPEPVQWPYATRLQLRVRVATTLHIELSVANVGERDWQYTLALHSYFQVGELSRVRVPSLAGLSYLDCLDNWQAQAQEGPLTVNAEIDRVFEFVPSVIELHDPALARVLKLTSQNLPSLVAWNPWQEKAKRLSQFGNEDYLQMLCLENSALLTNRCHLAAGAKRDHLLIIEATKL